LLLSDEKLKRAPKPDILKGHMAENTPPSGISRRDITENVSHHRIYVVLATATTANVNLSSVSSYCVSVPHERKIIRSGHIIVCEKERNNEAEYDFIHELAPSSALVSPQSLDEDNTDEYHTVNEPAPTSELGSPLSFDGPDSSSSTANDNLPLSTENTDERSPTRGRSRVNYKELNSGRRQIQSVEEIALLAVTCEEPKTYSEVINSELKNEWIEAINRELSSIYSHDTWETASSVGEEVTPLTSKWIFKIKRDEHGDISSFKARLVIRGFEQEHGINFDEVFSPVLKTNTLR
jgi:hypothetical protein